MNVVSIMDMCRHVLLSVVEEASELRSKMRGSHKLALLTVFLTNMVDNLLLTAVVPIIPSVLVHLDKDEYDLSHINVTSAPYHVHSLMGHRSAFTSLANTSLDRSNGFSYTVVAESENGRVGWLLSSKALVQLFANPLVGPLCNRVGYPILLSFGTTIILASSLVFALAQTYVPLLLARSLQGFGSAAAVISGMSIVAKHYTDDRGRSRALGFAMGGSAMGVLLGYPIGGIVYSFAGRIATFLLIAAIVVLDLVLQLIVFGVEVQRESLVSITPLHTLLKDRYVVVAAGAVMLTTMSMSVLEPTVPLWVMERMPVKEWELGLIFLPDSVGYLVGTNCFGVVAKSIGRWICTIFCMLLIALCLICLPFASTIPQLILPHFGIGLGLGITDAAIMPLLALLVDLEHEAFYGCVYAIAQLAVCLAYGVGPSVAGIVIRAVGFSWLMRGLAIIIILYCPLCLILKNTPDTKEEEMRLSKPKCRCGLNHTKDKQTNKEQTNLTYGRLNEDDD